MTTLEFVHAAARKEGAPEIARWGRSLQRRLARETLYLVGQTDDFPSDLKAEYWAALDEALSRLPASTRIEVSSYLLKLLRRDAPPDMMDLIESKTVSVGE